MSRVAYVNGRYVSHHSAAVHIEDRGYQFADGVYEVCAVRHGRTVDLKPHMTRLFRSLKELEIIAPMSTNALAVVLGEVRRRNLIRDGIIYIQVTRGVAPRDHAFPSAVRPSLVVTSRHVDFEAVRKKAEKGVSAITMPDIRWKRRDIKSISLLPNVLAKEKAARVGAYEAILVDDDGFVTEGSSSNVWIVGADGQLITRAQGPDILSGITRAQVADAARKMQIKIVERPFTVDEISSASEVFLTSTSACAMPIVQLDNRKIGNGVPGPVSIGAFEAYWRHLETAD